MKNEYQFVAVLDFSGTHIAIHFPDLDEALSQADTIDQAVRRADEVLKLTIESRLDDNDEIPEPTPIDKIELLDGQRTIIAACSPKAKIKYDKKNVNYST